MTDLFHQPPPAMVAVETDEWRIERTDDGWGIRYRGGWYVEPREKLSLYQAIKAAWETHLDPDNPCGWHGE